jgi:regulator of CtrA degradation
MVPGIPGSIDEAWTRKFIMARSFDGSAGRFNSRRSDSPSSSTICFAQRLAASSAFKALFSEGMALVEESAAYLDGAGRQESRALRRELAMAYATESMRLTTRLMQLASWLLLQRAVNEGDMTPMQAASEKHKVRLARQEVACAPELFEELPQRLRALSFRSMRLQARIIHLDRSLFGAPAAPIDSAASPIAGQVERLRAAFGGAVERLAAH